MKIYTWLEIKTTINTDSEVEDEVWVTPDLLIDYGNRAIDAAEQILLDLQAHDEYFKATGKISIVAGQASYDLPDDIYANKLGEISYVNGWRVIPVKKIRNEDDKYLLRPGEAYRYDIENTTANGRQIVLYPTPTENLTDGLRFPYTRNASRIVDDTSTIDIPEAYNFIIRHIKTSIFEKEPHPNLGYSESKLEKEEIKLRNALADIVTDGDNEIAPDLSHYDDFNQGYGFTYGEE